MSSNELVTIFIPVYNEQEILTESAERVHTYLAERHILHEVLVVSNGSTDDTNRIGRALAQRYDWFRFTELPERGVGAAFVTGVKQARGEMLVSLDIDLSFEMRFIEYALDLLCYADMVVGSKTMGRQRRSFTRVIGSQLYILVAQLGFGMTVSDYSPGCKAYRRSCLLPILEHIDRWTAYVFELCLYLHTHDRRVIQVGVECNDHRVSRFNLLHEGFYRYAHLWRCWRALRSKEAWFCAPKGV